MFPQLTRLLTYFVALSTLAHTSAGKEIPHQVTKTFPEPQVIHHIDYDNSAKGNQCVGSIKLMSEGSVFGTISYTEIGDDEFKNKNYGKVETITVEGNCCWRLATRKNGQGKTRDFTQDVNDSYHQEKIKSVKKISC